HLTDFRVYAIHSDNSVVEIPLRNPMADFNQEGWDIPKAIDDDPKTAWGIFPRVGKVHQAIFEFASHTLDAEQFQFVLAQDHGGGHLIGRFRLSIASSRPPLQINSFPDEIADVLLTPLGNRTDGQRIALALFVARQEVE